ncbi:NACHT, LRR and PYD domains-containing protein 3-like [Ambystoma mexicanum]|uniref:NACHT, LRR and PYD domains-containing protein 3-like n=1 Tax=Ambystoma mexicanum TaxID=8296 RepID=UPI0037E986B2
MAWQEVPGTPKLLLHTLLEELTGDQFKKCKSLLEECSIRDGRAKIPRGRLENADRMDTAELMVHHYGDQPALETAEALLQGIPRLDLLEGFHASSHRYFSKKPKPVEVDVEDQKKIYKEHIKGKFKAMKDKHCRIGEHVTLKERYTKLLIIKNYQQKEDKKHEIMSFGRKHAELMAKQAEHSYSSIKSLFDPEEDGHIPSTVVLQGVAGIGKTLTCRKIMLDWASGELFQDRFEYVFYIHCREHNQLIVQQTIADLIIPRCDGEPLLSMDEIESNAKKVLFIIDGFDELKIPKDFQLSDLIKTSPKDNTITSLISRCYLSKSYILITTRPTALETLTGYLAECVNDERFAEILGFSEDDMKEYFAKSFGSKIQGDQAFNIVKENEILFTMCFLPIVCWIVCKTINQQMAKKKDVVFVSKTTTSVYMLFLTDLLTQQSSDSARYVIDINLKRLCSLANEGIFERKILFDDHDITRHGVDIPDVQSLFLKNDIFEEDFENCNMYSFIHLSFQEFFAALFYVLEESEPTIEHTDSPQGAVIRLLEDYGERRHDHLMLTVRFLFGLINKNRLTQMERKFKWKVSSDIKPTLEEWMKEELRRGGREVTDRQMDLFHCLYETQDKEFVESVSEHLTGIKFSRESLHRRMNVMDFRALAFCINNSLRLQEIYLSGTIMATEDLRALTPGLMKCSILRMERCSLDGSCGAVLASFLRTNSSLTEFDISENKLGDCGMKELCQGLKNPVLKMHTLGLKGCSLTGSCCADLASVLRASTSLRDLDLSQNQLGDSGVRELCEGLREQRCKIQKLKLSQCSLTGSCCADLSSVLRINMSLTELNLACNDLQDAGVKELCEGLKQPECKIQKVWLDDCSLTGSCYADLASVLTTNATLTQLHLSWNKAGDWAVTDLCEGLTHPGCQLLKLCLSFNTLTDDCTEAMCSALGTNCSLLVLHLNGNTFTRRSEASFNSLRENRRDLELSLTLEKGPDGGEAESSDGATKDSLKLRHLLGNYYTMK